MTHTLLLVLFLATMFLVFVGFGIHNYLAGVFSARQFITYRALFLLVSSVFFLPHAASVKKLFASAQSGKHPRQTMDRHSRQISPRSHKLTAQPSTWRLCS